MAGAQRACLVAITIAACGRVGFQPLAADAPTADAPPDTAAPSPRVVTMTAMAGSATSLSIPIPATSAGHVLVVSVVTWDGTPVKTVTAGAPLTSAGVRAVQAGTSSELWYASPAQAGATNVAITMNAPATGFDAWVTELANVAPGAPAAVAKSCLQYPPTVDVAAVTTTVAGELVIGATMLAYPAFADAVAPPFTALPLVNGNGTAYVVADQPGTYGPTWSVGSGAGMNAMTCSSTAAFLPAN